MTIQLVSNNDTGLVFWSKVNQAINVINTLTDGQLTVNGSITFANATFSLAATSANIANNLVLSSQAGGNTLFLTSSNAVVNGTIFITGAGSGLLVSNNAQITGNLTIGTNETVNGNLTVVKTITAGNLVVNSIETVTGPVTLSNTLTVTGNATFSNNMTIVGNLNISNNDVITGNLSVSKNQTITGNSTLNNTTNVNADLNVTGNLSMVAVGKTATMNSSQGGWSTFNFGKQLLVTTFPNSSHPTVGITDASGANNWAITNQSGVLTLATMPAFNNGGTNPNLIYQFSSTGLNANAYINCTQTLTMTGVNVGNTGQIKLNQGGLGTAGQSNLPGYVSFHRANTQRLGYVGWGDTSSGNGYLLLESENGATGWRVLDGTGVRGSGRFIVDNQCFFGAAGDFYAENNTYSGIGNLLNFAASNFILYNGNMLFNTTSSAVFSGGPVVIQGVGATTVSGAGFLVPGGAGTGATGAIDYSLACTYGITIANFGVYVGSDRRIKDNITQITSNDAIQYVMSANPVTFTQLGVPQAGFIAQEEIQSGYRAESIQMIVSDDEKVAETDGLIPAGYKATKKYEHDIAYLTKALQYALQEIADLKAKLGG